MTWRPRGRGCFTQYSVQIDETNLPASSPSQFALSELAKEAWNWAQVLNTPNKNTPYVAGHSRGPPPPPPTPLPKPATAVGVCEYGKILFVIG